jgi:hypothetical protein
VRSTEQTKLSKAKLSKAKLIKAFIVILAFSSTFQHTLEILKKQLLAKQQQLIY